MSPSNAWKDSWCRHSADFWAIYCSEDITIAAWHFFFPPITSTPSSGCTLVDFIISAARLARYHLKRAWSIANPLILAIVDAFVVFGMNKIAKWAHCSFLLSAGKVIRFAKCHAITYTKGGLNAFSISVTTSSKAPEDLPVSICALASIISLMLGLIVGSPLLTLFVESDKHDFNVLFNSCFSLGFVPYRFLQWSSMMCFQLFFSSPKSWSSFSSRRVLS